MDKINLTKNINVKKGVQIGTNGFPDKRVEIYHKRVPSSIAVA